MRSAKRVKRAHKSGDELDKTLLKRREMLQECLEGFIDKVCALTKRYDECADKAARDMREVNGMPDPPKTPLTPGSAPATPPATPKSPATPTGLRPVKGTSPRKKSLASSFPDTPAVTAVRGSTIPEAKVEEAVYYAPVCLEETGDEEKDKKAKKDAEFDIQVKMQGLPDNSKILDNLSIIKSEVHDFCNVLLSLTEWITLMLPTVKEEDPFGAEIQMTMHQELTRIVKEIECKYDLEFLYIESRATLEAKYYKNYMVPTWRQCLLVTDARVWPEIERGWFELKRLTLYTYQCLVQNMEKLKNPEPAPKAMLTY
eukprot:Rhum_TRINITY_DN16985_c0_g1::Rhum_TRINITY_DN16985_c0_g1_i1::g.164953::m.164953